DIRFIGRPGGPAAVGELRSFPQMAVRAVDEHVHVALAVAHGPDVPGPPVLRAGDTVIGANVRAVVLFLQQMVLGIDAEFLEGLPRQRHDVVGGGRTPHASLERPQPRTEGRSRARDRPEQTTEQVQYAHDPPLEMLAWFSNRSFG